ncbi:MAG: TauD/TfdA family dioxygenase [Lautropia sp.]
MRDDHERAAVGRPTGAAAHAEHAPEQGPCVWTASQLRDASAWTYRFGTAEIDEVLAAVREVRRTVENPIQIRGIRDFPLPKLGSTLAALRREVLQGRGFVLLRGLPVQELSRLDAALAYWGVAVHFGFPTCQNANGHLLGHVTDLGSKSRRDPAKDARRQFGGHETDRGYTSRAEFYFHVDYCDIVGLLCLNSAKSGGESKIVSSATIHNEILRRRPDLLEILYRPFFHSRQNEIPAGAKPYYEMPVFHRAAGRFTAFYSRTFAEYCAAQHGVPPLTDRQLEAFDLVDQLANDPEFCISMTMNPGDIQLLNNHVILHTRTAYEDHEDPGRKRHLLRLWLVAPEAGPLSDWYYEFYGGGRRGGIYVPGVVECAPVQL